MTTTTMVEAVDDVILVEGVMILVEAVDSTLVEVVRLSVGLMETREVVVGEVLVLRYLRQ